MSNRVKLGEFLVDLAQKWLITIKQKAASEIFSFYQNSAIFSAYFELYEFQPRGILFNPGFALPHCALCKVNVIFPHRPPVPLTKGIIELVPSQKLGFCTVLAVVAIERLTLK